MEFVPIEVLLELFSDGPFQSEEFATVGRVTTLGNAKRATSIKQ